MSGTKLEVRKCAAALGAEIGGVDLAKPLDGAVFEAIHAAFLEHRVVFFRDQKLAHTDQIAFGRRFGALDVHPIAEGMDEHPELIRVLKPAGEPASFGVAWHSDNSFFETPSLGTMLYGVKVPPHGGDTLFASMERSYDTLSETMKGWLADLRAIHSAGRAYDPRTVGREKYDGSAAISYKYSDSIWDEVSHPVVRTHPETGRKSLYVNAMFTQRVEGLRPAESRALLDFLFEHCAQPELTCRFRWEPGSLALWDNRCVQHYALDDYQAFERLMYRVTICGDRPV